MTTGATLAIYIIVYAVTLESKELLGPYLGTISAAMLPWAGAAMLISASWDYMDAEISAMNAFWHYMLLAAVLGLTFYHAPAIATESSSLPAPLALMNTLLLLVACPILVTSGPLARHLIQRMRG